MLGGFFSSLLDADDVTPEEEIKDPLGLGIPRSQRRVLRKCPGGSAHSAPGTLPACGNEFAFVGRQRRLRVGDEWYRIDLLFSVYCTGVPVDRQDWGKFGTS